MGRGGRSLVLLCSFATLLLISLSAVSGVQDESGREFRRFVGRLGREHSKGELRRAGHVTEELKQLELDTVVDEKKPAEGIWEKARSFVSGVSSTLVGDGIPNPAVSLVEKTKSAQSEEEDKSFGRRDSSFGRRRQSRHSNWAGIRDLIRNHPERIAAAGDISATEPLAVQEDVTPVTPRAELLAKIKDIVMTVAEEHHALTVETDVDSTCADAMEGQVKIFVKSVKSALLERLCNADVSTEDQSFCNLLNENAMMATLTSLWMTDVNPVKVPWHETSKTAACSSVDSFRDFAKSLKEIEGLARESGMLLPEGTEMENIRMGHDHGHHTFREHGARGRNWLQRMWHKHMTPDEEVLDAEDQQRPVWQRFLISKFMKKHPEESHEHGDHERHWWKHSGETHEDGDQEKQELGRHGLHGPHHAEHSWKRVFWKLMKHRQMRHQGFDRAHGNSEKDVCFQQTAKYLTRGIKHHLATTCQSTTAPNVLAACQFAKEHHFLVKVWLAAKIPVFSKAAKSCANTFENRHARGHGIPIRQDDIVEKSVDAENSFENRHARGHGIPFRHDDIVKKSVDAEVLASSEVGKTNERELSTFSHWMSRGCARNHANREFSKTLHLRGHMIGMSSRDNGENGLRARVRTHLIDNAEDGLGGHVRTHFLVLEGGNLRQLHDFQHVFQHLKPLHYGSYEEMFTDLQGRLDEFIRETETVSSEQDGLESSTERMTFKPFRHHAKGPHFRISANPRVTENNETPVFESSDFVEEQTIDKSPEDASEGRAVM